MWCAMEMFCTFFSIPDRILLSGKPGRFRGTLSDCPEIRCYAASLSSLSYCAASLSDMRKLEIVRVSCEASAVSD